MSGSAEMNKKEEVFAVLDSGIGFYTTKEVTERTPWSKPTVLKRLKELYEEERIKREPFGNGWIWWRGEKTLFSDEGDGE